jgi:hypothetical protein
MLFPAYQPARIMYGDDALSPKRHGRQHERGRHRKHPPNVAFRVFGRQSVVTEVKARVDKNPRNFQGKRKALRQVHTVRRAYQNVGAERTHGHHPVASRGPGEA